MIEQLTKAAEVLAADLRWRDMLAVNAYWASYEGFLQSSLLWAFNNVSTDFSADRERQLLTGGRRVQPDLVVLRRTDESKWWAARDSRRSGAVQPLVHAAVMLKVAWDAGHSRSGATPRAKARAVRNDEEKLRQTPGEMKRIVGVAVGAWAYEANALPTVLAETERVVLDGWETRGVPLLGTGYACGRKHCAVSLHLREIGG